MAGSALSWTHGTAMTSPARAREPAADSEQASQAAIPARGARSGQLARASHGAAAAGTAVITLACRPAEFHLSTLGIKVC